MDGEIGKGIEESPTTCSDIGEAPWSRRATEAIEVGLRGRGRRAVPARRSRQIQDEANGRRRGDGRLAEAGKGTTSSADLAAQADELERQAQARRAAAGEAEREAKALEQLVRTTKERLDREERILAMSQEERQWADALLEIE